MAFVTARVPFPLDTGGKIRSFHLLKEVSQAHEVTLVTGIESERERQATTVLRDEIPRLTLQAVVVPRRNTLVRRVWRAGTNAFDALPYSWAGYRHARFTANVRAVLGRIRHDVVHCDHIQVAHAVMSMRTPPRILNAHNVESVLMARLAAVEAKWARRRLIEWQARKVRRAEKETYARFDTCVAMSEVDRARMVEMAPAVPVVVVPNGVDLTWFRVSNEQPEPDLVVFSGSMDWEPNVDAALYFARNVLPRIRRWRPGARFVIAGRDPAPRLRAQLDGDSSVAFTGTVADIRPYLAKASLVVVPLRVGSGTRLKILEAWAMAKPVLSTTLGAEGLPARDGENIAIADSAESMAVRAVQLLTRRGEAECLGSRGRRLVEERYSWGVVAESLSAVYEEAVGRSRRLRTRDSLVPDSE